MRLESKKYHFDIHSAAALIEQFTRGKSRKDHAGDALVRSAVERQFEIVGEALGKLLKLDSATASRITEYRRIISFRNVLIHGYDAVSNDVVWDIVETKLPVLLQEVAQMLAEPEDG